MPSHWGNGWEPVNATSLHPENDASQWAGRNRAERILCLPPTRLNRSCCPFSVLLVFWGLVYLRPSQGKKKHTVRQP